MTSIIIPNSVINIGYSAFGYCNALRSITIPFVGTTKDGASNTHFEYIFGVSPHSSYVPSSLKSVVITGGTSIGERAFSSCASLTSITIPDSVTSIGEEAFANCTSLTSITIPDSVTSIGEGTFANCDILTSVSIGNGVTSIGERAFYNCDSLTSVSIGDNVTSIGADALSSCDSLTSVYISDIASWCGIEFGNYSANPLYYAKNLYLNNTLITDLVIPDGVTKIPDFAFKGQPIKTVAISDSVTSIGYYSFQNCTSLTSVTFGENSQLTSIGIAAFYGCTSLTSIKIPDSVTSIGEYAFCGCTSLTSVTFGENSQLTSIGVYAFEDCSGLTSITIPFVGASRDASGCESHFGYIFGFSTTLTQSSGYHCYDNGYYYTFNIPPSLKRVIITSKEETNIGYNAFHNCNTLTSITIGNNVTSIGFSAFEDCSSLTSIKIPDSIISIGWCTFLGCSSLERIEIPDSVTSIGAKAFSGCSSLERIEIPDSVTSIGAKAFSGCSSLVEVYYCGTAEEWGNVEIRSDNDALLNVEVTFICGNHAFTGWVKSSSPTCITVGEERRNCMNCIFFETRVIGALGHTWNSGEVTLMPTIEEVGKKLFTCTACSATKTEDIPKLTFVVGDLDGSEEITSADAVYLLMNTFFPEDYPITDAQKQESDFDGDGEVNSGDAVYLLMYTFFPEDYPLGNTQPAITPASALIPTKVSVKKEDEEI